MSTGTKPLLEYKRPADCWCCSSCETENNITAPVCRLCGASRNARCLTLKQWNPEIHRPRDSSTGSTRLRGTFAGASTASAAPKSYTPDISRPTSSGTFSSAASAHSSTSYDAGHEKKSSGGAVWLTVIFAAIIIIVAVAVVYANAAEPAIPYENTDSVFISSDGFSFPETFRNDIISEEGSYVL